MKRLLKEPLLHFLLIGAAFFVIDARSGDRAAGPGENEILVSRGHVMNLSALFAKTWQRPPTPAELRGLVDDFVLEEALYREGKALGVDQNDTVIRRRVRQKMEFVVDDIVEQAEPSEAQVEAWLVEHRADYTRSGRFRFRQLFLDPERHEDDLTADAREILTKLRNRAADADPRELGDPSLLEHAFDDVSTGIVAATFGEDFATSLATLPIGEWSGPIESAFGMHLIHIDERTDGQLPALDEVRAEVERDWSFARREEASERFNEALLARYRVVIEWPDDAQPEQEP